MKKWLVLFLVACAAFVPVSTAEARGRRVVRQRVVVRKQKVFAAPVVFHQAAVIAPVVVHQAAVIAPVQAFVPATVVSPVVVSPIFAPAVAPMLKVCH